MPTLILLCGMVAVSWYAWLAFRSRVSMSAIGSVMVIAGSASFSCGFPRGTYDVCLGRVLPGGLGDAGQLAAVGHVAQPDPAQAELAVDGLGPPALLAAGVRANGELGLA